MIEKFFDKFEPESDILDRRILYEVTKMRVNGDDFRDSSSGCDSKSDLDSCLGEDHLDYAINGGYQPEL